MNKIKKLIVFIICAVNGYSYSASSGDDQKIVHRGYLGCLNFSPVLLSAKMAENSFAYLTTYSYTQSCPPTGGKIAIIQNLERMLISFSISGVSSQTIGAVGVSFKLN